MRSRVRIAILRFALWSVYLRENCSVCFCEEQKKREGPLRVVYFIFVIASQHPEIDIVLYTYCCCCMVNRLCAFVTHHHRHHHRPLSTMTMCVWMDAVYSPCVLFEQFHIETTSLYSILIETLGRMFYSTVLCVLNDKNKTCVRIVRGDEQSGLIFNTLSVFSKIYETCPCAVQYGCSRSFLINANYAQRACCVVHLFSLSSCKLKINYLPTYSAVVTSLCPLFRRFHGLFFFN